MSHTISLVKPAIACAPVEKLFDPRVWKYLTGKIVGTVTGVTVTATNSVSESLVVVVPVNPALAAGRLL
jgi:hypothetical protein